MRIKRALFGLLATIGLSATAAGAPAADAPGRIRFAYASRSNSVTPKHVAQSKGFFKAE
ncbi:MAG: hypothetical protein HW419_2893 [Deltaproteobacteria bacterium]|nr:hypothetical protein [Deltaproteobacteria bacterium]